MIIGAAGGVGSIATQLAKHAGLTVIGTASRPESVKWVKELGADEVINHFEPFVPQLQALGYEHVDYIFCLNTVEKHWKNMGAASPCCSRKAIPHQRRQSPQSPCAHRDRKNDWQSGAGAFQLKKKPCRRHGLSYIYELHLKPKRAEFSIPGFPLWQQPILSRFPERSLRPKCAKCPRPGRTASRPNPRIPGRYDASR